jgi:hypothetical protein
MRNCPVLPDLDNAIQDGKEIIDYKVESALLKAAPPLAVYLIVLRAK